MKKIYLVKKDPAAEGQDNWITMNGYEFAMFMKTPEGQARKDNFGQLDACSEDDNIIVMECGAEKAKEWRADKDRRDYLKECENASGFITFSYSAIYSEEGEISGEDMLPDDSCDIEEEIVHKMLLQEMRKAISSLTAEEIELINALFLDENPLTEGEFAALHNEKRSTVNSRKYAVLRKLKNIMGEVF